MTEETRPAAVYVAWTTFKNAIEVFAQGLPNRVDRSVFPGQSGGVQNQLLAGFRFLGLIDDDGKPEPKLRALAVPDEGKRKEVLEEIIKDSYSELFSLDLTKATPAQLAERMGTSYNVSGNTRDKAIRFFLGAVGYLELPISPLFAERKKRRTGAGVATRRRRTAPAGRPSTPSMPADQSRNGVGASRTVQLNSGGAVTLLADVNLFSLSPRDREFVFGLIDQVEKYAGEEAADAEDDE